ncbi:YihY family inner membrane protein [Alysiella filiformis]|nr:YihY family inner membrane protein [Alysiella filiformis]
MRIVNLPQQRWFQFALFILRRFNQIGVAQVAGSLTFTTLLALVPVLTVMLVVVAAFPMFEDVSAQFMEMVNDVLVPSGASTIMAYLNQFKDKANGLTAISLLGMGITSILLIQTIDQTFNRIWRVKTTRSLFQQIPIYWALLTLAPVALGLGASLTRKIQAALPHLSDGAIGHLPQLLFTLAVLYFAYRVVPNRYVPSKHALCGAFMTALAVEIAKWGFGIYIRNFNSYELIYGVFAAVPVFLIWLNVLWILVLTGAVMTASFSYWRGNAFLRSRMKNHSFDEVLTLLLLLKQAHLQGKSLSLPDFRQHVHMGYDELGDLLETLAQHDYVSQDKNRWVMKKSSENIILLDLANIFVYKLPEIHTPIQAALQDLVRPCVQSLNVNLDEFAKQHDLHAQPILPARLSKMLSDLADQHSAK